MKKKRDDSVSLSLKVTRIMKITLILILVGVMMASSLTKIDFDDFTNAIPTGTSDFCICEKRNFLRCRFTDRKTI